MILIDTLMELFASMPEIWSVYTHIVYQQNTGIYVPRATHICILPTFDRKVFSRIINHNGNKYQKLFCAIPYIAPHGFYLLKGLVSV